MNISTAYSILLCVSLGLMLAQLSVARKRAEHIVFAIFSGSLAMVSVKVLSADLVGPYQYIIGLGTCATCNVIWLVSRAIFRGDNAIGAGHIAVALVVALLVMMNQGVHFASATAMLSTDTSQLISGGIGEVTQLLSSTVLMLSMWEALRTPDNGAVMRPWQCYLFAFAFFSGVMLCTVVINLITDPVLRARLQPVFVVFSALFILITTQLLLVCKERQREQSGPAMPQMAEEENVPEADATVIDGIRTQFTTHQVYLTPSLKMIDVANALGVSEYKISRAIRYHFDADNFSHLVNQYRVAHAKALLVAAHSAQWSVLVIGLESGFSSLSSFNRAFKAIEGCSPNAYRQQYLQHGNAATV
ncbi:AraC family transcriptional regulator [Alteromonas sp. CYL-A6]|uniref:AraC family transcriptional regulator n=1 Tax=Alteromonas nitratireducens TaxID=3390813 RepID=UPI0034AF229E